jgi:cysteine desulfurase
MDLHGYFDHNATTPLCEEARQAWLDASDRHWVNPSSPYRKAAQVHVRLYAARERLADLLDVDVARVVFNSGATEGNNSVFAHWSRSLRLGGKVAVSPTEHPSVIEAAKSFFEDRIEWLELNGSGEVDLDLFGTLLEKGDLAAVSVMAANNETGVINPWAQIAGLCRKAGVEYHCDASQWIGKMPLVGLSECDYLTGCAHKFGGPRGVGFVILPVGGVRAFSSLKGGVQEQGHRAGTEDVAGVLSMLAALDRAEGSVAQASSVPRDAFIEGLHAALPGVELIGVGASRLWNTCAVIMPEFASERWIRGLEKCGFYISAGAACAAGKAGPSHVLAAMQVDPSAMRRVLRISSSLEAGSAEWLGLLEAVKAAHGALREDAASASANVISID